MDLSNLARLPIALSRSAPNREQYKKSIKWKESQNSHPCPS